MFNGIYITVYNTEAKKIERLTSLTFTRVFLSPVIEQWHINWIAHLFNRDEKKKKICYKILYLETYRIKINIICVLSNFVIYIITLRFGVWKWKIEFEYW